MRPSNDAVYDPRVTYEQEKLLAPKEFGSLIGVFETARDEAWDSVSAKHGLTGFSEILVEELQSTHEDGYSEFRGDTGGFATFLLSPKGKRCAAVCIDTRDVPIGTDEEAVDYVRRTCILFHELGHVDDFQRRINFREGVRANLEEAELYAHRFTCKKLKDRNYRFPLAYYLRVAIEQLAHANSAPIANAARRFIETGYKRYAIAAGHAFQNWKG
jgi:hypothetical protein